MDTYQAELRNKNRGYMKLIVWQRAIELFALTWKILCIEAKIDFMLRSQLLSVQSISANIAEGYGRRFVSEYIQFLHYGLDSVTETMTRAIALKATKEISEERFRNFDSLHYEVENRLLRLIEKLEEKRDDEDWVARLAEDPEKYSITPSPQHSITPSFRHA